MKSPGRRVSVPPSPTWAIGLMAFFACLLSALAQKDPALVKRAAERASAAPPTLKDVSYGGHVRQIMDVWLTSSIQHAAPLVLYIHGGGWNAQEKSDIYEFLDVRAFLNAGISVASINYRFLTDANEAGINPPIQWPLHDATRALQFARSKASEWHLAKTRIAVTGVSAGGGSSLWLGLHDDMADPQNSDPVARESTRVCAIVGIAPVVCLDPKPLREWIPNAIFGAHAFGFASMSRAASFAPFLAARDEYLPDIRRYSPIEFVSKDDPPVFIEFPNQDKPPVRGDPQTDPNHSALSGVMLEGQLKSVGVSVELRYKGDGKTGHKDAQEYLLQFLAGPSR